MKIYIVGTSIHYSKWIENSELVKTPKEADIIMFTGGEDVDPSLYGDSLGKYTYINTVRDMYEKEIFYKYSDKFKIGICRGLNCRSSLNRVNSWNAEMPIMS
jgi:gamma-glutamyl-gamma-aminobutyrate hydrolase PuuD